MATGSVELVARRNPGLTSPLLSLTALSVFAMAGDIVPLFKYDARPTFDAVCRDVSGVLLVASDHDNAFVIVSFPRWLTEKDKILVATDMDGFYRKVFLEKLNSRIEANFVNVQAGTPSDSGC